MGWNKSLGLFGIVLIGIIFFSSCINAQELSLNVVLDNQGGAIVLGIADANPDIAGIDFENKSLSGFTQYLTAKQGANWIFNLNSSQLYDRHYVRISLPVTAKLLSYSGTPVISSDQGSLVLEFSGKGPLDVNLVYTLEDIPVQVNWMNVIFIIVFILLIVAVIILFLRTKKRKKEVLVKRVIKKKESKLASIRGILNQRENLIIDILIKEGRRSTQGKLQKLSEIPKASFSRHLSNLAKKGIVIKEGSGKLNVVKLIVR